NWIQGLIRRGQIDEAIREYQGLLVTHAGVVRLPLADLLIVRNSRLPEGQRRWDEIEKLITDATAAAPQSGDPTLLRVRLLLVQGQEAKGFDTLETARAKFPKEPRLWIAQVELLIKQKKLPEAQALLGQAQKQVGDRVDLRLSRAAVAVAQGGTQVVPTLNGL